MTIQADKSKTPEQQIIADLLDEVASERFAQIEKWGQRDRPSVFGESDRRNFEKTANYWKQINDARVELDSLAWDGILLEEVFEALAESDDDLRRQELIQVAAVALAEVECIDRRTAARLAGEGMDAPIEDEDRA